VTINSLLDSNIDLTLERYRNLLAQGAVLIDDSSEIEKTETAVCFPRTPLAAGRLHVDLRPTHRIDNLGMAMSLIGIKPDGSKADRFTAGSAKIEAGHLHLLLLHCRSLKLVSARWDCLAGAAAL
jgi:phage terminase large subunit-like protein